MATITTLTPLRALTTMGGPMPERRRTILSADGRTCISQTIICPGSPAGHGAIGRPTAAPAPTAIGTVGALAVAVTPAPQADAQAPAPVPPEAAASAASAAPRLAASPPSARAADMDREEFVRLGEAIWGRWGWQTRLSEEFGCRDSTVRKYKSGRLPVPRKLAAFLREKHARLCSDSQEGMTRPIAARIWRSGTKVLLELSEVPEGLRIPQTPQPCVVEGIGQSLLLRRL